MSNLECHEFQQRLDEAVELRRPPQADLHEHANECDVCRTRWEEYLVLEEAVPLWCAAVPSVDFTDSILAQLANDESDVSNSDREIEPVVSSIFMDGFGNGGDAARQHRSRFPYVAVAAAALFLIGTFTVYSLSRPPEPQIVDAPTVEVPISRLSTINRPEQPEYSLIVRDASSAYLELASEAASAISDGAALLPTAYLVADANPKPTPEASSWIRKVGSNLEPIGNNLESAIDFLFEAPPPEHSPAT